MPLNDIKTYQKYDKQQISSCNELLPQQVTMAWNETSEIKIPASYKKVQNIVFVGMGGSALGAHLIKSVFAQRLSAPFEIVRNYTLPGYVSSKSLVILSSFSGTTEEVLHVAKLAKEKKAKILIITSGGNLSKMMKKDKIPGYVFEPGELAKQPRLGLGFSVVGVLGLLKQAGLLKVTSAEITKMKRAMDDVVDNSALDVHTKNNPAKTVAHALHNKAILVVAAEHLVGNAHVLANQINESGKQYATYMELPELNHHFLEGLDHPKGFFNKFVVLMVQSELYNKRIQKRFDITADIFEEQGGEVVDYIAGGDTAIEECGELIQFSGFVSCYLAMLSKVDPYGIPFVDDLKKRMAK